MDRLSNRVVSMLASKVLQLDPGIRTRTARKQLLYGAWVSLAQLAVGLTMGFVPVLIPQLLGSDSKIPITRVDASWIASVLLLACSVGSIISGIVMDSQGRRIMLIFSQIPMFAGWLLTSFARSPEHLIIGQAITGVGCGMAMCPPRVYCTEISLANMRAVICSFSDIAVSIGIILQTGLGTFLNWKYLCCISCCVTFVNCCSFTWLPETPYFVLLHKNEQETQDNLAKFRGPNYNLDGEMDQIEDFKVDNGLRKTTCNEKIGLLNSFASCRPFWLVMTYVFFSQAVGNSFILYWAIELLTVAKSSFDPEIGNILMGLTRMVMSGVTGVLLFRIGRRTLAITSAVGVAFVCIGLGMFLNSNDAPSSVPLISLILYMAFATLGYYILPILMSFELYPLQLRGILGGTTVSLYCLAMFASTKMEHLMMDVLGLPNTFILFGCFSLLGMIFLYLYLPETKDLTLQEIEEYYKEVRPTLISQRRIMSMSQLEILSRTNLSKSKINVSKTKVNLTVSIKPSVLAKLQLQKQVSRLDTRTRVLYEENGNKGIRSALSAESKNMHVIFDEPADKKNAIQSEKDAKRNEQESKDDMDDDKEIQDEDQPSTSKKNT